MSRKKTCPADSRTLAELITLLCLVPALIFGCAPLSDTSDTDMTQDDVQSAIHLKSDIGQEPSHTDIFVFNDDALRRIDAYQRVTGTDVKAASRAGDKIMVAISNSPVGTDEWRRIGSYDGLMEEISLLSDEDPDNPIMSGQITVTAGSGGTHEMKMSMLMSEIHVRTLCADFHGTSFDGEPLTDVRIYLTNVNSSCAIMKQENFRPEMIVNSGRLDYSSIMDFKSAGMLCRDVPFDLTSSAVDADIALYCYPNDTPEETYGSPFTRLVIEGKIGGTTCYYPITINREENGICFGTDGTGIGRDCLYEFDITLCRFGTSDPDTPVRKGDVTVRCTVEPWTEKPSETINY